MANRYCVLVTGNNNYGDVTTWSANSNGVPTGATVPGNSDFIYPSTLIAAGATLVVNASNRSCARMDWTGVANSPAITFTKNITSLGNVTIAAGMTINGSGSLIFGTNDATLITNGVVMGCSIIQAATGKTLLLGANLTMGDYSSIYVYDGTLDTNNKTVICADFGDGGSTDAKTITLGSSVINAAHVAGAWSFASGGLTLSPNTATINIGTPSQFDGGSSSNYNIVNLVGAGSYTITGSNSFAQLNPAAGATITISFTDGTTQNIGNNGLSGSAGHVHTLQGTSTGGWNINYTGAGRLSMDYVAVTYSTATPDHIFYDYPHGTDNGHNTHWYFTPPSQAGGNLGAKKFILDIK